MGGGGGGWHKVSVFGRLPLAAPIGLSPLLILTLCGSERVLVVSTEPPDDLSCSTPAVGCGGGGGVHSILLSARPVGLLLNCGAAIITGQYSRNCPMHSMLAGWSLMPPHLPLLHPFADTHNIVVDEQFAGSHSSTRKASQTSLR